MKKIASGFTLFELLVSISIIAIITALVSISYSNAQRKARDTKIMEDLNMVQKAAEQYYSVRGFVYPPAWGLGSRWTNSDGSVVILNFLPNDPKGTAYRSTLTFNGPNVVGYCLCSLNPLEASKGNADFSDCSNIGNVNGTYYCVQNQQ